MAELVYPPVIGLARTMFKVQGLRLDISGTENMPRKGGAVLVSNHIGYLDFIFAGLTALPAEATGALHGEGVGVPAQGVGSADAGHEAHPRGPLRGQHAYKHALTALRSGEIVGVFPEATISQSFTLKSFKSGAARLARRPACR